MLLMSPLTLFLGHNNLQKPGIIDVHGLKPEEALQKTEQAFRDLLSNGQVTLRVIVGKGLHSKNKVPAIKNFIIETMRKYVLDCLHSLDFSLIFNSQHIPCSVDPYNAGVLILTLSPET